MSVSKIVYNDALLLEAVKDCLLYHSGQKRKVSGVEYASHPLMVSYYCARYKGRSKNWIALSIAMLLHDGPEDTTMTAEYILKKYGPLVLSIVMEMTNDDNQIAKVGKVEYQKTKLVGVSTYGFTGKLLDMLVNCNDNPSQSQLTNIETILAYVVTKRKITQTQKAILADLKATIAEKRALSQVDSAVLQV